jgi:hypothetical protein
MAPELFFGRTYNETIDVFSFSIILVSLILRIEPDPDEIRTPQFGLDMKKFASRATAVACPEELVAVTMRCADLDPSSRPSFENVEAELYLLDLKLSSMGPDTAQYGRGRRTSRTNRPLGGIQENAAGDSKTGKKQRKAVPAAITITSSNGTPEKGGSGAGEPSKGPQLSSTDTEASELHEARLTGVSTTLHDLELPSPTTLASARAGPPSAPPIKTSTPFTPKKGQATGSTSSTSSCSSAATPSSIKRRDRSGRLLQEDIV